MPERSVPHLDVAGYVLGTLTPAEAAAFEAHLPGCRECTAELAELGSLPSMLANAAPAPPPSLRRRTFEAIATAAAAGPIGPGPTGAAIADGPTRPVSMEGPARPVSAEGPTRPVSLPGRRPGSPPSTPSRPAPSRPAGREPPDAAPLRRPERAGRGTRQRAVRWMVASAAALLVVAAVGAGVILYGRDGAEPRGTTVALAAVEGATGSGEAVVREVAGGREIRLQVSGLPVNQPGTFYECWLVGPDDAPDSPKRVSIGTFTVEEDGTADVVWVTAADPARFPKMGVTLEPDDGDPDVNGPKVLAGV